MGLDRLNDYKEKLKNINIYLETLNEYKENLFEEINRSNKKFGNTLAVKY